MNPVRRCTVSALSTAISTLLGTAGPVSIAHAGPLGAQITAGGGQVSQSGTTTTIRQSTQNLSLNWQSFNVGAAETVNFVQPGAGAIAVNRVLGSGVSDIFGHLNANGQVWLINPNGVLFGRGSQVDVGGLVASTLDVADPATGDATGSATHAFGGAGAGRIVNQGSITAAAGGYVALLGNGVDNQGTIAARLGTVALGAGSAATLTFAGNRLLQVQIDAGTLDALAQNSGLLAADGGAVFMSAGAKSSVLAASVNTTGVIRANTVENHGGTIVLSAGGAAGSVGIGGTVDASATAAEGAAAGGPGGAITATADQVLVAPGATLDASGSRGGGVINIGGGWQGGGIAQAVAVSVAPTATLIASATVQGNGGEIVVRSDVANSASTTRVYGTLTATGGPAGGSGGRIETSGAWLDVTGSRVDTSAAHGTAGDWLLDPQNVTIGASGTDVSGSGTITYVPAGTSTITASSIVTALQGGTNVTITTGTTGGSLGDITVASAIAKASGNTDVTLTLQAADSIIVNAPISNTGGTGKLNVNLYADNDNGTHDGVGVVILYNNISTGGGNLNFGTGATATINGVANTLVGGDVYVGGSSAVNLTTGGGNVNVNGQLIIGNPAGLNLDTTNGANAGNVLFAGLVDSGDSYALVNTNKTWNQALVAAKSGVGAAVGDTYLATITSRLENAVASYTAGYTASWLGGERIVGIGTDAVWRLVTGPEGLANGGLGLPFFTQNGSATANGNGGTAINGAYTNWNSGEPNNYQGANLTAAGRNEWVMQFVGTQGQWNDLPGNSTTLPYLVETNLANAPLNVNAGTAGTVTFANGLGTNKPLLTLGVTGQIILLNNNSTTINTTGSTNLNGQVQLNGTDVNVLTVTAPSVTTTYGATLPTLTPTYSGFLNNDTVSSLTSPATVSTTGTTAAVSTAPITASGAVDPNYLILYDPGTLIVNPAPVAVTGTTVTTRVYNGTTAATLTGGTLSGVFSADSANVTLGQAGTFVSKDAGTNIAVTVADTLGGSAAADYALTQPTGVTGIITPKPLTVGGSAVTNRVYDGTFAAALTGGSLVGVIGADVGHVSLSQSGTFASKDVGTGIAVTATDALSGAAAGDYSITQPAGLTGSISALGLTVSGSTVGSKVYDGTFAAPVSGGTLVGVVAGDAGAVGLTQAGSFASKIVGTNIVVTAADALSGAAAGDYTLTQPAGLTGSITPLGLNVSGTVVAGKTYDGTVAATLSGGALVGVVAGDAGALSLAQAGSFASKDAGTNIAVTAADVLSGAAAGNYSLIQPAGLTASITPLPITVSGSAAGSKTYDGTLAAPVSGGSLTGVLAGDVSGVSLVQSGLFASIHAGTNIAVTATDTLTGAAAQDYALVQPGGLTGSITPLAVSVSGSAVGSKVYDGTFAAPVSGGALVGVLAGDAATLGLTQAGSFASNNVGTNIAVTAADALTGAAAGDYNLTQPAGLTGSITPLSLTVSGSLVANKTYDGTLAAALSGGTLVGVVAADAGALSLAQGGSFASKDAGTNIAVTAADALTGTAAGNYSLIQPAGLTGTITPLSITVSGTSVGSKTYDGTLAAPLSGGTLVGVLAADASGVALVQSGLFASLHAGTNIAVTATDTLTGAVAQDYALAQPGGLTGTITPLALSVSGSAVGSKVYDGTTTAPLYGGALVGVLAADTGNLMLSQTGSFVSKNAGPSIGVNATDSLIGSAAGDYSVIQPTGLTGSITPLSITATGSAVGSKTYDGTYAAPVSGGSLVGILAGDVGAVTLSQSGIFASRNAGTQIAVTVADALGGAAAGNYLLIQPAGLTGTINPAHLTLAGTPVTATKTYDGTTAASTSGATLNGVVAGDGGAVYLVTNFASANAGQSIPVLPSLGGTLAGDYVVDYVNGSLTGNISPAPLLATADRRALTVGGSLPPLSGSFSGFVAGQSLAGLQSSGYQSLWTTTAGSRSPAGSYAVIGAFNDPNYVVSQAPSNSAALSAVVPPPSNATTAGTVLSAALDAGGTAGASGAAGAKDVAGASDMASAAGAAGTAAGSADEPGLTPFGGRRLVVVSGGVNTGTNAVTPHE